MSRRSTSSPNQIRAIVPPLLGWQSYPRAVANLFAFGFVALGCEWLVHQVEYLKECGSRFDSVMAHSPHRLYMAPIGILLVLILLSTFTLFILVLSRASTTHRSLLARLPAPLRHCLPNSRLRLSWGAIRMTGLVLAACQIALYLAQENLETFAVNGAWPGLWILFAHQHLTVLPLHFLAASCGSTLLWGVSGLLRRSRQAIQVARVLLTIFDRRVDVPLRIEPRTPAVPSLRPCRGDLGLRSPPVAA